MSARVCASEPACAYAAHALRALLPCAECVFCCTRVSVRTCVHALVLHVCVRACVSACVHPCTRACVRVRVQDGGGERLSECARVMAVEMAAESAND